VRNFFGGEMPLSTNQAVPEEPVNDISKDWHPNVSQKIAAFRSHFAPLSIEEKITYRKWRRATIIFYGAFAFVIAALSIAIGPADPSTNVNNKEAHSAIASAGQRTPH
jgi:hypothetical protein